MDEENECLSITESDFLDSESASEHAVEVHYCFLFPSFLLKSAISFQFVVFF